MSNPFQETAQSNNPWFVVSIGLLCFMVGYGVSSAGLFSTGTPAADTQIAAVPMPPAPPSVPSVPEAAPDATNVPPIDPKEDHIRGNPNAKISIIEYSDFECPFCKRHHPTMTQIMGTYGDDVNWVYRHYPLSFHANAEPSALASECVAELGGNDAFWEFADKLMAGSTYDFAAMVKEMGINESKFQTCFESKKYLAKVNAQMTGGSNAGVSGTPGSIVLHNETDEAKLVSGAVPFASFQSTIDAMLQ